MANATFTSDDPVLNKEAEILTQCIDESGSFNKDQKLVINNLSALIFYRSEEELKSSTIYFLAREPLPVVLDFADKIRHHYCGDEIHLRGLIEFSNHCRRNCLYCGIRKDNRQVKRYRLTDQQIIDIAVKAGKLDYKTVVLQSGEDVFYTTDVLCRIIEQIKKQTGCAITLSAGEKPFSDYKKLRDAGADRYLLRFETANRQLFKRLKPDSDFEQRVRCLKDLKQIGFQVGSGCMIGLPGQTIEDLADDIIFMVKLDLDMIGIGPFIANPETPLAGNASGTIAMMQKFISLVRILTRNTHIPATTAVGSIDKQGREKILRCGANVIMPNLTPQEYRPHYRLYPDKICVEEQPGDCRNCVQAIAERLGRFIAKGPGHSLKNRN